MTEPAALTVDEVSPVTDKPETIPAGKDPSLMVVEIDCRVMAQVIPGGLIAYQGIHRYRLQKHFLPVLQGQLITDHDRAELARCTEVHDRLLNKYIEDNMGRLDGVQKQLKDQELRSRYGGSPELLFTQHNVGRSIPPFNRVTVIEEGIPAPKDEAVMQRAKETAELVKGVVGGGNSTELSAAFAAAFVAGIKQLVAEGVLSAGSGNQTQNQKR